SKIQNPKLPDLRPLVLLALLGGIVWAAFILGAGVELRAFEQHRSDANTADQPASSVAQSFRSPRDKLSELELELGSYVTLPADGRIRVLKRDGVNGPPVYEASVNWASFAHHPYLTYSFLPISASEDANYTLIAEWQYRL